MSKARASRSSKLVQAARAYGEALKRQHRASAAMHRARFSSTAGLRERDHDAACVALDQAEHELLVTAAMLSGFSRRSAGRSV